MTAGCVCTNPLININANSPAVCVKCGNWYLGNIEEVLKNSEKLKSEELSKYERDLLREEGQRKFPKKVTNFTPKKKKRKK